MPKTRSAILMGLLAILLMLGCSHSGINPVEPPGSPVEPAINKTPDSQRVLWGVWDISFDPVEFKVIVEPARNALIHFNITDWLLPPNCDDCLKIAVNTFDPVTRILDADVTLRNPTDISGYDIRGILYTNDYGHLLKNADAWTDLWDIPAGQDINPFKAFAKTEPNRIFEPDAEHTENYLIYIPLPPHWNDITFAVDASWPGNCREPYAIDNFQQLGVLYDYTGDSVDIQIDVLDWQDDVIEVLLHAEDLTGELSTALESVGGNTWSVEITNAIGLQAGEHYYLISAESSNAGVNILYQYITITITEGPEPNPVDVTPDYLNLSPNCVCLDGNFAYVGGTAGGLHIFDITDPALPVWIGKVDTELYASEVVVEGSYAYVADAYNLHIIDISNPHTPVIVNTVETWDSTDCLKVFNGYAYLGHFEGLEIIDVDPPASAYSVKKLHGYPIYGIEISGNYAFMTDYLAGLRVVDITDPENPEFIHLVEGTCTMIYGIVLYGNFAYITDAYGVIRVIDISSPESAYIYNTLYTPGELLNIVRSGDYAYAHDWLDGVFVIDISDPDTAHYVNNLDIPGTTMGLAASENYLYVADIYCGLHTVDISSPESAYIANTYLSPTVANDVDIAGDYAYVAGVGGVMILDISIPESVYAVDVIDAPGYTSTIDIDGDYAYLGTWDNGLQILDISNPFDAQVVTSVEMPARINDITVHGENAYVTLDDGFDMHIVDIDPPESAHIVKTVDILPPGSGVTFSGGYVYVCGTGFKIIDVDPIETSHIVTTIEADHLNSSTVSADYAYVSSGIYYVDGGSLLVVDIDPPESASIVKTIGFGDDADGVALSGNYAYVSVNGSLQIIDISEPDAAHVASSLDIPASAGSIILSDGYAYIAGYGFHIIKLW